MRAECEDERGRDGVAADVHEVDLALEELGALAFGLDDDVASPTSTHTRSSAHRHTVTQTQSHTPPVSSTAQNESATEIVQETSKQAVKPEESESDDEKDAGEGEPSYFLIDDFPSIVRRKRGKNSQVAGGFAEEHFSDDNRQILGDEGVEGDEEDKEGGRKNKIQFGTCRWCMRKEILVSHLETCGENVCWACFRKEKAGAYKMFTKTDAMKNFKLSARTIERAVNAGELYEAVKSNPNAGTPSLFSSSSAAAPAVALNPGAVLNPAAALDPPAGGEGIRRSPHMFLYYACQLQALQEKELKANARNRGEKESGGGGEPRENEKKRGKVRGRAKAKEEGTGGETRVENKVKKERKTNNVQGMRGRGKNIVIPVCEHLKARTRLSGPSPLGFEYEKFCPDCDQVLLVYASDRPDEADQVENEGEGVIEGTAE